MAQSTAARKLGEALFPQEDRLTVAIVADRLGVTRQAVHAWIKGASTPRAEHMARLEELTGIPMQEWFDSAGEQAEPTDAKGDAA